MKSEGEIGVLDDQFPYGIVVRRSDGPTITALLEEAGKLAERKERLLCITSEGAIFHFAERQAAVDFVFQCKARDIDINLRKWPVHGGLAPERSGKSGSAGANAEPSSRTY
jgi:hypothetical protein